MSQLQAMEDIDPLDFTELNDDKDVDSPEAAPAR